MQLAYSTQHATARMRQRGIPMELLDLLVSYGEEWHDGHGSTVMAFSKRARRRLVKDLGPKQFARWESRLNVYAVVSSDGGLITAGHRLRHFRSRN